MTSNLSPLLGIIIGAAISGFIQLFLERYRATQARQQLKTNILLKIVENRLSSYQLLYPHLSGFIKDSNLKLVFRESPLSRGELKNFLRIINELDSGVSLFFSNDAARCMLRLQKELVCVLSKDEREEFNKDDLNNAAIMARDLEAALRSDLGVYGIDLSREPEPLRRHWNDHRDLS